MLSINKKKVKKSQSPHSIESTVPSAVVDDDGFLNPNLGVVKLKSMY